MSGSEDHRRRFLLGAFGDPGHAFPMIALGGALAARGHQVTMQTWRRWHEPVEQTGMRFAAAPEYQVFPTRERPLKPYEAAVRAAQETRPLIDDARPDAVVADILTPAVALAAEAEGVTWATLVPHVFPPGGDGFPPYSIGARLPRTRLGRAMWRTLEQPVGAGLRRGREELNGARARLGLPALAGVHGGISRALCLVGTFPHLEYPRAWPPGTHVVGPLLWEPPAAGVELPPGEEPLVLVAPSTSQDPEHRLLRAAVAGLADLPVRVLATINRRGLSAPLSVPPNARLVEWVSYAQAMPHCDVVVCHGGHGTMVRALASGCSVVVAPATGDMHENAARADWAGVGVRVPWRFVSPSTLRLAVQRALGDPRLRAGAGELAAWAQRNRGAERAAGLVEQFAARQKRS
ncbi:MAG: glycosyl transferase [Actinomycetota bacterium]|nr:glycosyl transferase [Actinomycetota bacterium]